MVYGRDNELDNYGIHGVYKLITRGPHPAVDDGIALAMDGKLTLDGCI